MSRYWNLWEFERKFFWGQRNEKSLTQRNINLTERLLKRKIFGVKLMKYNWLNWAKKVFLWTVGLQREEVGVHLMMDYSPSWSDFDSISTYSNEVSARHWFAFVNIFFIELIFVNYRWLIIDRRLRKLFRCTITWTEFQCFLTFSFVRNIWNLN